MAAACSGGDDVSAPSTDDQPTGETVGTSTPSTATPDTMPDTTADTTDTSTRATAPPTTAPPTTAPPTTQPAPVILPTGVVWRATQVGRVGGMGVASSQIVTVDDEAWIVGGRWNGPVLWRSTDGETWTEVVVEPPPSSGSALLDGLIGRPDGGLLAWGHAGSDCYANEPRENGYREVSICRRIRPIVYLSDDGTTWQRVDPSAMAPGGSNSVHVSEVTAVDDGFVAVGTHRGPDWYGLIWSSPDGENWNVVRELRGADGPMSGREALWDGTTLVVLAHEHPCSQGYINYNTPGWILGTSWANHLRLLTGPSVDALEPVAADGHPILEPPRPVDCAVDDPFFFGMEPYADAAGAMIGGRIALLDLTDLPDDDTGDDAGDDTGDDTGDGDGDGDGDEDAAPIHPRRIVTLIDGTWEESFTEGIDRSGRDTLVELDGRPAILRATQPETGVTTIDVIVSTDDGWELRTGQTPLLGRISYSALSAGDGSTVALGDRLLAVMTAQPNPFESVTFAGQPVDLLVASSRPTDEGSIESCAPTAGTFCAFGEFAAVPSYPNLAGADFAGVQAPFADLGAADYSGADFGGATLTGAEVEDTSDFTGTDFAGAILSGTELEDLAGANLAGADLQRATIGFSAPPASFEGAVLERATLELVATADGEYLDPELVLAGLDLTSTRISGSYDADAPLLRVVDLRGSVLDGASFYATDLTGVQFDEGLDWSVIDVWDNSLCPDGQPPTDGPIGTCVRE